MHIRSATTGKTNSDALKVDQMCQVLIHLEKNNLQTVSMKERHQTDMTGKRMLQEKTEVSAQKTDT